jgi:outer membrane protein OmpA-like peptidoglycan-associated protein
VTAFGRSEWVEEAWEPVSRPRPALTLSFKSGAALVAAGMVLAGCGPVSGLETRARILSEPPCTDFFFPIYFGARSVQLTPAAARVIRNAGHHAEGCQGPRVEVVGLADPGQPAGSAVSHQRAQRLAEALQAAGLPRATFQANPLGANAPAGPDRRRADVFIRFQH